MRSSRVRKFVAHAVPIKLPWWFRRSDLLSLLTISSLLVWIRYADISYDNFCQFMTTSFKFEELDAKFTNNINDNTSNTSKFFESLIQNAPHHLSTIIIKHSTATISLVYLILFISFLLFSSPIYQLRYIRNKEFTGYSFLVYFIYCWLFISMLSHLPILYYLVEEPLALFPYFYALTVFTVSIINATFRLILNRIFVFHIGIRKRIFEILQSSAFISLACSTLYATCGNANTFEIFSEKSVGFQVDGSVIFCQKLFQTVALSGTGNKNYTDIPPVLTMWLTGVTIMCVNYLIEGTSKERFIFFSESDLNQLTEYIETEIVTEASPTNIATKSPSSEMATRSPSSDVNTDMVLENELKTNEATLVIQHTIIRRIVHSAEPRNIHPMVSWFAMSTGWVLLDIVIALGIFLDRYDKRELNKSLDALKAITNRDENKKKQRKKAKINYTLSFASMEHANIEQSNSNSSIIFSNIDRSPSALTDYEQCNSSCFGYLQNKNELWFDFMADCGDGFHSGYEIARLLAQPYLIGTNDITLKRAKLLLIGGDLSYPGPTALNFQQKFFRVFEDAMRPPQYIINNLKAGNICPEISYRKPELPDNGDLESYAGPTCLIIPGNHDWYDGLQTFCRFICSRNWLGGWYLPQTSSYFVTALPHNWWIFAADYALNGDIDPKQFEYFAKIVETYFDDENRSERVIIMTHLPDWIINDHEHENYGSNLQYLINNVIGSDRLRLRLAGDIHNYTRHESESAIQSGLKYNMMSSTNKNNDSNDSMPVPVALKSTSNLKRSQSECDISDYNKINSMPNVGATLIVSGGGGAFLHPTHVPEKKPILYNSVIYQRICEYPSIIQSRAYSFFNIFDFRKRNLQFDLLGGILYYLMVSSLFPICNLQINSHIQELTWRNIVFKFYEIFINNTFEIFEMSYISVTVFILGFFGLYFWTESMLNYKLRIVICSIHLIAHYISSMTVIIVMEMIIEAALENELIGKKSPYEIFESNFEKTHALLQHLDGTILPIAILTPILKILFTVTDITGFHVSLRKIICENSISNLPSRATRFAYHITACLFYFIFAAPVVSFIVGLYLFLMSAKCGKFNEAFSSLRLDTHKNFVRFHLKNDGSLHCFVVGVDKVPHRWRQDPKWDGRGTLLSIANQNRQENNRSKKRRNARDMRYLGASHTWNFPSRWIPYNSSGDTNRCSTYDYRRVKIIDQFILH